MILTNITQMSFRNSTEKDLIKKFATNHPDWVKEDVANDYTVFSLTRSHAFTPEDTVGSPCKCENCAHVKTQILSTGAEQLICELSSDWRVVHPTDGCNHGKPIE